MNRITVVLVLIAMTFGVSAQVGGWDPEEIEKAEMALEAFISKDPGLADFASEAYAYVVFPGIGKGAAGIGGAHGRGVAWEQGEVVGRAKMTQITIGFQWGGQAYREVIFFEDEQSFRRFKRGELEFSGQVSAVAVTAGASADISYENGVAIFTMTKGGLMYEASIGGQKFKYFKGKEAN